MTIEELDAYIKDYTKNDKTNRAVVNRSLGQRQNLLYKKRVGSIFKKRWDWYDSRFFIWN